MTKDEKRWIVLLVAVLVIAIVLIVVFVTRPKEEEVVPQETPTYGEEKSGEYEVELSDGTKMNVSEELKKAKTYNGVEISNVTLTEKDGVTILRGDVTNKGEATHERERVKITLIGANDEAVVEMTGTIVELQPGETKTLDVRITGKLTDVKDYTIEAAE